MANETLRGVGRRAKNGAGRGGAGFTAGSANSLLAIGLVAAVPLWALTNAAARSTIGGEGWSLNGNGSLAVLFPGAMAVLAAGWAALASPAGGTRQRSLEVC